MRLHRGVLPIARGLVAAPGFTALSGLAGLACGGTVMRCDIREPHVLKAMGKACAQLIASKGYVSDADRRHIADRIVAGASAEETNVDGLVALALVDQAAV